MHFANRSWNKDIQRFDGSLQLVPENFYYMTCYRQENTYSDEPLTQILAAMDSLDAPTIYPVHPRNRDMAQRIVRREGFENVLLVKPVSYGNSVQLIQNAKIIVTDSGGLQCEAFFAGVQCVLVFDRVVWLETMVDNRNQLAKADKQDIPDKLSKSQRIDPAYQPFGDGRVAEKICDAIREWQK